jgi:hypothetical protein
MRFLLTTTLSLLLTLSANAQVCETPASDAGQQIQSRLLDALSAAFGSIETSANITDPYGKIAQNLGAFECGSMEMEAYTDFINKDTMLQGVRLYVPTLQSVVSSFLVGDVNIDKKMTIKFFAVADRIEIPKIEAESNSKVIKWFQSAGQWVQGVARAASLNSTIKKTVWLYKGELDIENQEVQDVRLTLQGEGEEAKFKINLPGAFVFGKVFATEMNQEFFTEQLEEVFEEATDIEDVVESFVMSLIFPGSDLSAVDEYLHDTIDSFSKLRRKKFGLIGAYRELRGKEQKDKGDVPFLKNKHLRSLHKSVDAILSQEKSIGQQLSGSVAVATSWERFVHVDFESYEFDQDTVDRIIESQNLDQWDFMGSAISGFKVN